MVLYASKFDEELVFEDGKVIVVRGTEVKPPRKELTTEKRFNAHVTAGSILKRTGQTGYYSPISTTHSIVVAKHYANAYVEGSTYANPKSVRNRIIAICIDENSLDTIPEFFDSRRISDNEHLTITSSKGKTINILSRNRNYLNASQEVVFMENITSSDAIRVVELPEKISDIAYAYAIMGGDDYGKKMANHFVECYIRNPDAIMKCVENIESRMNRDENAIRKMYYSEDGAKRDSMKHLNKDMYKDRLTAGVINEIKSRRGRDIKNEFDIDQREILATFIHAMSIRKIISNGEFASLVGIKPQNEQLVKFTGIMEGATKLIAPNKNVKNGKKEHPTYGDIIRLDGIEVIDEEGRRISAFKNWASALYHLKLQRDKSGAICGLALDYSLERKREIYEGIRNYGGGYTKVFTITKQDKKFGKIENDQEIEK